MVCYRCDPRTQDPKLPVASALCKYFKQRSMQVWRRMQVSACSTGNENTRGKKENGKGKSKNGGGSTRSSGQTKHQPHAGKGIDKNRCKLCHEVTDPRPWAAMCTRVLVPLKRQGASSSSSSAIVQQPLHESHKCRSRTLETRDMEHKVSLAACLTQLTKNMLVTMHRTLDPCERDDQRFLEYHAQKDTLTRIVDTGAEIHVVCERNERRHDRTTVKEGAVILDTAGRQCTD